MKKLFCAFVILLTFLFVAAIVAYASTISSRSFLRQSEEQIRAYLLELTPTGMSMEDARILIEQHFHVDEWVYRSWMGSAFIDYENGIIRRFDSRIHEYNPPQIGIKAINLSLGSYRRSGRLLAATFVFASWGFDENSELVDIYVSKSRPAL